MAKNNVPSHWTPERVDKLKQFFAEEMSTGKIALELGGFEHCQDDGRNSVCSKLRELKLVRPKGFTPKITRVPKHECVSLPVGSLAFKVINGIKRKQKLATTPGIAPEPFVCKETPDVVPLNLTMAELQEGQCRYVYGDEPEKMVFCGHPIHWRMVFGRLRASSYCEAHYLTCVGTGTKSERRAAELPSGAAA